MSSTSVVVVGGGYAGVMAANRLTRRDDVGVTLVNPRPRFVERIRLHQRVGGSHDAVVEYPQVLAAGVRLVVGAVTRIDAGRRRVELADGSALPYDHLVYAVGSRSADRDDVPGAAEFALGIGGLEDAERLRQALGAAGDDAPVVVVGAGPTGIETASELAGLGRAVTLVGGEAPAPYLHPRARASVLRRLERLGVTVLDGDCARVVSVHGDSVELSGGWAVPGAVTVWTAGFAVPDLAARSGLTVDAAGRLLTDETLTSVDDPRIVAAGDCAAPSHLPYRMSCQAAMQLGPQAAETVLSRIEGDAPVAAGVGFAGQCISLGRRDGVFQVASRDDVATGFFLRGRPAARLKEVICRSIRWELAYEARRPGVRRWWIADGHREQRLAALGTDPVQA